MDTADDIRRHEDRHRRHRGHGVGLRRLLGRAGNEVWAIDTWQDHVDVIADSGLAVSGASGSFTVDTLHTGRSPDDAGPCDLWVIGTKASAVEEVAAKIAPLLRPDDVVMAFQNGLGAGERVARQVPGSTRRHRDRGGIRLVDPRTGSRAPRAGCG